ncbi:DUF3800 domain-containing protein [Oenococcus sicerae]|uniref:DUF3800 domain-containing protein n=2 Tax=Oenococcus sicerae TaxID=2203724 RepID=UPI0039E9624F
MKTIYLYIDDSGTLNRNAPQQDFVYAGYAFIGLEEKNIASRKYHNKIKQLRKMSGRHDELKAANISKQSKYKLFKVMQAFHSFSVHVDVGSVYSSILSDKKSIHRYKDYVVKRVIKSEISCLIDEEFINDQEDLKLIVHLDEQATATDGYYDLKSSIMEELHEGIQNRDYGKIFQPIIYGNLVVAVSYFDSKVNYLGQSADILANRIWASYVCNNGTLRKINFHCHLTLP